MGWGHHGWLMGGGGGWMILINVLVLLLVFGSLFAVIFFAVRAAVSGSARSGEASPTQGALQILAQRYANGEISTDEYREMKKALEA